MVVKKHGVISRHLQKRGRPVLDRRYSYPYGHFDGIGYLDSGRGLVRIFPRVKKLATEDRFICNTVTENRVSGAVHFQLIVSSIARPSRSKWNGFAK